MKPHKFSFDTVKKTTLFPLLLLSVSAAASCASGAESKQLAEVDEGPVNLEIVTRFPADWLPKIEYATSAFNKSGQDLGCFSVLAGRDEEVDMDFVAITPTANLTLSGGFGRVEGCGIGVAYYFDDNGAFVRSEMQR